MAWSSPIHTSWVSSSSLFVQVGRRVLSL
uniref:Predicted protein n=1 Tax=Hordeum vulgare subsp. vulgare TaxID=112509 RepID=F2DCK2_HORVV|nr:predicted protein [Hordeum vulgare subsp. vulgare]